MNKSKKYIPLYMLQGLIASCAIENSEHDEAYENVSLLIEKYDMFRYISWDNVMKYIYGGVKK